MKIKKILLFIGFLSALIIVFATVKTRLKIEQSSEKDISEAIKAPSEKATKEEKDLADTSEEERVYEQFSAMDTLEEKVSKRELGPSMLLKKAEEALSDPSPDVRGEAVSMVCRSKNLSEPEILNFIEKKALKDSSPIVRKIIIFKLLHANHPKSIELLEWVLKDECNRSDRDEETSNDLRTLASAFLESKGKPGISELTKLLDSKNNLVRYDAAITLAFYKRVDSSSHDKVLTTLIEIIKNCKGKPISAGAIGAMGNSLESKQLKIDDNIKQEIIPLLKNALSDPYVMHTDTGPIYPIRGAAFTCLKYGFGVKVERVAWGKWEFRIVE